MKERVSKLTCIPHAPTLLENAVYIGWQFQALMKEQLDRKPVSSELHKIILAKGQKGYKLFLKKIKSEFTVKMHIYILYVLHNY